jgi:hypothetical protein
MMGFIRKTRCKKGTRKHRPRHQSELGVEGKISPIVDVKLGISVVTSSCEVLVSNAHYVYCVCFCDLHLNRLNIGYLSATAVVRTDFGVSQRVVL